MNDINMQSLMREWKNMGVLYKTSETSVEDIFLKLQENSNDLGWEKE